jgi:hypothetical protein
MRLRLEKMLPGHLTCFLIHANRELQHGLHQKLHDGI